MASDHIPYYVGADYNPDQWPERVWMDDIRLMKRAGINLVTLPVFSWSRLEPADGCYDLDWLGRSVDLLHENGIRVCMATPTNAPPFWLTIKHPDILSVNQHDVRHTPGERGRICPSNSVYKTKAAAITRELAIRFAHHPAVVLWHISNEYHHRCFCEQCAQSFRDWLRTSYGNLDELNRAWYADFWGHRVYDWNEIIPPTTRNELFTLNNRCCSAWPGQTLDFQRFSSDAILGLYLNEKRAIKDIQPTAMVTTNFLFANRNINWQAWAPHLDVIAYDSYPINGVHGSDMGFTYDLLRSLKHGQPFYLMEQSPGPVNWMHHCSLKRPGQMRLWSHQATAHGSDASCFFQFRASRGGVEKFHGAIVGHAGRDDTRTFQEVARLGQELGRFGHDLVGSRVAARTAVLMDWDNWIALDQSPWPSADLHYLDLLKKYYRSLWNKNIPVDVIASDANLDAYDFVMAPLLYLLKPGVAAGLDRFVRRGGILITSFMCGMADRNDLMNTTGFPGELRSLLGIWSEELDAVPPSVTNRVLIQKECAPLQGSYATGHICELVHPEGAQVVGVYGDDFYAGYPALTVHHTGKGRAYYVATDAEDKLLDDLVALCCNGLDIKPILNAPANVEVSRRDQNGQSFIFLLNHNQATVPVATGEWTGWVDLTTNRTTTDTIELEPHGVAILTQP